MRRAEYWEAETKEGALVTLEERLRSSEVWRTQTNEKVLIALNSLCPRGSTPQTEQIDWVSSSRNIYFLDETIRLLARRQEVVELV